MNIKYKILIAIVSILFPVLVMGQGKPYEGPIDPAGDPAMEREGSMNGNQFRMLFNNNTQLSDYPRRDASKWPNNNSGTKLLDVCSVEIGAEVYITQDSIPVTDLLEVARLAALGQIDTLFYIQTADYVVGQHQLDMNHDGTVEWALSPVPGYINLLSDYPAMSNRPDSWPPDGWPSTDYATKWRGQWFGRYGAGLVSADLETYFVANDAQDMEYIINRASGAAERLITNGPRYHPRGLSKKYVGDDARPGFNATTQIAKPWGGLGIRVEVRGYQWNNPETRDMIFWEYNIANISDYDLSTTGFGYFIDPSIGGDTGGDGETCYFDANLDLSYIWEVTGVGAGGLPTGVFGMAYLESPGKPYDNVDNDNDGLLNESRDNEAGILIGPKEGIDNLSKFLAFYKYEESDLRWHFEGDEDQDWYDGNDVNNNRAYGYYDEENGVWQLEPGEDAGDDVGLDGLGPLDVNYPGPDEGECNHRPDYRLGVGCEPNFNAQDVSEADQIGLTSQHMMDLGEWGAGYKHDQDERIWNLMKSYTFVSEYTTTAHIFEFFASATFPLYQGKVERISIAMLAAYDNLTGLMSGTHEAPRLFKKKQNAQVIYERDYRFAQPPERPTLKAYAGNGRVILTWNDAADKYTREPLLGRTNDFEGYKLYRSTDKYFQDAVTITDAHGVKSFKEPIFQCDKVDNIMGYSTVGIHNVGRAGTAFYLGEDTGISHSYIDEEVQNGRTYYYYLAAYDYGIEEFDISPAENEPDYDLDADTEEIIRLGSNVQVVIPRSTAAGYIPPYINIDEQQTSESILPGEIVPEIVIPGAVKEDHSYRVTFEIDTLGSYRKPGTPTHHPMDMGIATNALYVYDMTDNGKLVYSETYASCPRNNIVRRKSLWEQEDGGVAWDYTVIAGDGIQSDFFDGIRLTFNLSPLDTAWLDVENSKWITGSSKMTILSGTVSKYFAWDYDIVFTDTVSTKGTKSTRDWRDINDIFLSKGVLIRNQDFNFYVVNKHSLDARNQPEKMDLLVHDINRNGVYDWQADQIVVGHILTAGSNIYWAGSVFAISFSEIQDASGLPKAGDIYMVRFKRPKNPLDSFVFSIRPETKADTKILEADMESIRVVPNPYIATNSMESAVANPYLNQGRRIMFTHLPAQCVIRIFTPIGVLVDVIDVANDVENGTVHWDLLTKEDLEIAAGMYVYQVEDKVTGKSKVGKFAVIK